MVKTLGKRDWDIRTLKMEWEGIEKYTDEYENVGSVHTPWTILGFASSSYPSLIESTLSSILKDATETSVQQGERASPHKSFSNFALLYPRLITCWRYSGPDKRREEIIYWEELQKLATLCHYWILRVFDQRWWNLRVVMQEFIDLGKYLKTLNLTPTGTVPS